METNVHTGATDNVRFVLAFYGAAPSSSSVKRFFQLVVSRFSEFGFPPHRLGVMGLGFRGSKMGSFRRTAKKLDANGFDTVDSFSLDALMPDDVCGSRHFVSAEFCRSPKSGRFAVLSVPTSCVTSDALRSFAHDVIECLRPAYGIAYERSLNEGPIWYALGVLVCRPEDKPPVDDEYERGRSISRWSNIGMVKEVYREGLLRYVYRWNFLTPAQLNRQVEGVSLAKWIEADGQRGTIEPFCNEVWLWEVPESQLEMLRDRLHEANAIFDWRRYCDVEPHIKTVLG